MVLPRLYIFFPSILSIIISQNTLLDLGFVLQQLVYVQFSDDDGDNNVMV